MWKEISMKKFMKSMNKRSSITIYKDESILCKYIKIKFINTSKDDKIVRIDSVWIASTFWI